MIVTIKQENPLLIDLTIKIIYSCQEYIKTEGKTIIVLDIGLILENLDNKDQEANQMRVKQFKNCRKTFRKLKIMLARCINK
jgi:hypothetical protein